MTTHPCTGHQCDNCFTCDVLGVCCVSSTAGTNAGVQHRAANPARPDTRSLDVLRTALRADNESPVTLALRDLLDVGQIARRHGDVAHGDGGDAPIGLTVPLRALPRPTVSPFTTTNSLSDVVHSEVRR